MQTPSPSNRKDDNQHKSDFKWATHSRATETDSSVHLLLTYTVTPIKQELLSLISDLRLSDTSLEKDPTQCSRQISTQNQQSKFQKIKEANKWK